VSSENPSFSSLSFKQWLILVVAAIGFLFDTYELLMLPVIAAPALAELLGVPPNNPLVREWIGILLWSAAVCGGVFGLLGGWLVDRFGRKTVMVGSILMYSFSPVLAAFSTSVWMLLIFRCTTFIGVCVEFVAAITWLSELFPDKRMRELAIGWTQAFASVGGLLVTGANQLAVSFADQLPSLPIAEPLDANASWRYTLITGLVPGALILLLLPFVPESRVWLEKKRAGILQRPSFFALFTPELRRITLLTAVLSGCAYAAAFGALQVTPTQIVPGMATLAEQQKQLAPLRKEATALNEKLNEQVAKVHEFENSLPALRPVIDARVATRRELRKIAEQVEKPGASEEQKKELSAKQAPIAARLKELTTKLDEVTASQPEAKQAVIDWEKTLVAIGKNRALQKQPDDEIKGRGNFMQFWQEMGGLAGRIILAVLLVLVASRRLLLRLFQLPGLFIFPLTYWYLYRDQPDVFVVGIFMCGLVTVAQFSYFGEYLPKAFPLHLRGLGASFATNVGGRMIGTSAAFLTANIIAPQMPGGNSFVQTATAAAIVGTGVYVIGLIASSFLPEPKDEITE
jgi:MFS family permease